MEKKYQPLLGEYSFVGPGTAGVAQRIARKYDSSEGRAKEKGGLVALTFNEVMKCGHNQY